MRTLFFLAFFCLLIACKKNEKAETTTQNPAMTEMNTTAGLPSISEELILDMFHNCDFIDVIFYSLPISMSQGDKHSIQQSVSLISQEIQPMVPTKCANHKMARISWQKNGEIMTEADLYFGNGCGFYIFVENEQPKYGNKLTEQGHNFYGNIINQASQAGQQITNGQKSGN